MGSDGGGRLGLGGTTGLGQEFSLPPA